MKKPQQSSGFGKVSTKLCKSGSFEPFLRFPHPPAAGELRL